MFVIKACRSVAGLVYFFASRSCLLVVLLTLPIKVVECYLLVGIWNL